MMLSILWFSVKDFLLKADFYSISGSPLIKIYISLFQIKIKLNKYKLLQNKIEQISKNY